MEDTDWRPGPSDRRIGKPEPVKLFLLCDWDGGGGCGNRPNGFIVKDEALAKKWVDNNTGSSYNTVKGVIVQRLEDIPEAQEALDRQKALDKLTDKEKQLLGLEPRRPASDLVPGKKIREITRGGTGLGLGPED